MARLKDNMGNERNVVDEAITISIERFKELIIKESKYDDLTRTRNIKESEDK